MRATGGNTPEPQPAPSDSSAHAFHYTMLGMPAPGRHGHRAHHRDSELLRRVALKQLNANADANDSARTRFLREAQITAQLDHPNIVPVYALEVAPGGTPAYTMKLVEGRTFHALLNEARDFFAGGQWPDENRSLAQRLEHFLKVCDAMAYAHDKGAIHRDLKPANLMLGRHNEVYVMDWGLCRILRQSEDTPPDKSVVMSTPDVSGSASETRVGDVVGTPKYMAPEQAQGRNHELDARSDQCALGLILYEMVTLNPPYKGRRGLRGAGERRRRQAPSGRACLPAPAHSARTARDHRTRDRVQAARPLRRCGRAGGGHPPLPARRGGRCSPTGPALAARTALGRAPSPSRADRNARRDRARRHRHR